MRRIVAVGALAFSAFASTVCDSALAFETKCSGGIIEGEEEMELTWYCKYASTNVVFVLETAGREDVGGSLVALISEKVSALCCR